MAITRRTVVRVETSRETTNSRRAAVTLCVKAEVAPEIQMAKRLERIEKRKPSPRLPHRVGDGVIALFRPAFWLNRQTLMRLPEIHTMIYNYLWPGALVRDVHVFRVEQAWGCCNWCSSRARELPTKRSGTVRILPWSPSVLMRLSSAHRAHWRPIYYGSTRHLICPGQLDAYKVIFFDQQIARDRDADGRPVAPVCSASVVLTAENIARASLHVIYQARDLFPNFSYYTPIQEWSDEAAGAKNRIKRCQNMIHRLERWYRQGSTLLPGAGKITRLFLDDMMNLWIHPNLGYLASFLALD
ncbi:hypothetical protein F5883DRAFT_720737 [Diaporthe sp. PMI_573]|nr:hypothetical protein F5883DRAFT_720737 [Diaporthaceae sp. PMI_573]